MIVKTYDEVMNPLCIIHNCNCTVNCRQSHEERQFSEAIKSY